MNLFYNSSNSSSVVWSADYSNNVGDNSYATVTTTSSNMVQFSFVLKRCRSCKHSHAPEGVGCYNVVGTSVAYVICSCKEHVPEDNLEFLEYLSRKKELL